MKLRSLVLFSLVSFVMAFGVRAATAQDEGGKLFLLHCAPCHMPGGTGLPGLASPLLAEKGAAFARRLLPDEGRSYLAKVLISGLVGTIDVGGERYNGLMPNFAQLPDSELAMIANYLAITLNARALPAGFVAYRDADFAAVRGEGLQAKDVLNLLRRLEAIVSDSAATKRSEK